MLLGVRAADPDTFRRTWHHGALFPGVVSTALILYSLFPHVVNAAYLDLTDRLGVAPATQWQII